MSSKTDKKKTVAPKLRFPEFRDAGPWEVKRLGKVFQKRNERNGSGLKLLSVTLSDGVVRASQLERKTNASPDLSNYKKVYPNDIVYNSMRMWQGASGVSKWHGIVSPAYTVLEPLENHNSLFWAYYFKLSDSIEKFARYSQGVTSDTWNLKFPAFSLIRMAFPSPPEQQKIADCLSSLDEVIELQTQKLEALKAHKKGLMQQLFPCEGETTPRLRFPEFRDAGPWEVKRLGEVVKITGGGTPSKSKEDFWRGYIPWVSSSDIFDDSIRRINITRFISEEAIKQSATKLVPENSILLVSRVGVGKLAVSTEPICTSQDFTNLTPYKDDVLFLAYYLKSLSYVFESFNQGMAIKGFTKEDVESLNIALPDAASGEQQKISDCLSSLDEVIELQTKKIEALKAHKKGLMQQLFPQEVG